jgi:hypothetical protein
LLRTGLARVTHGVSRLLGITKTYLWQISRRPRGAFDTPLISHYKLRGEEVKKYGRKMKYHSFLSEILPRIAAIISMIQAIPISANVNNMEIRININSVPS